MEAIVTNRIHIGNVIRNAIAFNFKRSLGGEMTTGDVLQSVSRLFDLLDQRQIEYLLAGGIAMLQYVQGRNTEDIDLIMASSSLESLPEIRIVESNQDFARGKLNDLQIDVLLSRNPLFEKVLQEYRADQQFVERTIPCATIEGLLLLKMYALPSLYRQGGFARVGIYENDIATLIERFKPQLDPLFKELSHHLSATDLKAVRDIITEIEQRIARFHSQTKPETDQGA